MKGSAKNKSSYAMSHCILLCLTNYLFLGSPIIEGLLGRHLQISDILLACEIY